MRLDLTTLLNGRATKLDFDTTVDPTVQREDGVLFPDDMTFENPVRVIGTIRSSNGYLTLEADVSAVYLTRCDRCLGSVRGEVKFPFRRLVSLTGRTGAESADDGTDPDEILTMTDSFLDADAAILEEVALELPVYHLCRPDCPGLCPRCGKPLADGPCGCDGKKEIDPRLVILQKLLDKSEKE